MRTGGNNHLTHYLEQPRKSRRLEGRAGEIMLAARVLFERHGVAHVPVKDIAREAQITRELFYYYYPDKQAVINAVVDDFVEDLVESARVWKEQMAFENSRESLRKCIQGFRRVINNQHFLLPLSLYKDHLEPAL